MDRFVEVNAVIGQCSPEWLYANAEDGGGGITALNVR